MAEKKNETKRQTKAGMLGKDSESEVEKGANDAEKDAENPPKITKEKAAERDTDRPLH